MGDSGRVLGPSAVPAAPSTMGDMKKKGGTSKALACPDCGSTTDLGTTEQLSGIAPATFFINEKGEVEADFVGEPIAHWDVSETTGIECRCGWVHDGTEWDGVLEEAD